jgi:Haemolymph juvenile hormone binding protein (JHBP)
VCLLLKGFYPLLLPALDPLHIGKLNLLQGAESKVNIALKFHDIDMHGLSKAKVYRASGFNEISKLNVIDIRFFTKKLIIKGPYEIDGKVILLPIVGKGNSVLSLGKQTSTC